MASHTFHSALRNDGVEDVASLTLIEHYGPNAIGQQAHVGLGLAPRAR